MAVEKKRGKKISKKYLLFVIPVFILILAFMIYLLFSVKNLPAACNDGTLYNECSKIKPYICMKGILTEKASICGCDNVSVINEERCISDLQKGIKNITLNYTLRGERGEINFTVYDGLSIYLSRIPRYIDSTKNPTLLDFKLKDIDNERQRELLLPLVIEIENLAKNKEDQARIAISLVQNIPFGNSNKTAHVINTKIEYQRYPYEVLYDMQGICSEKSELLVFLLREIGYGTSFLYYNAENHEAVGIKCPLEDSLNNTEFCFVETTGPSIITDDKTEYFGVVRQLNSVPEVLTASEGISLGKDIYEYKDARTLISIRETIKKYGAINIIQHIQFQKLRKKYGLISI
jgi:hypothetical protein